jgi:putative transcriptional regulator
MLLTAEADLMESAFMRSVIYLLEHHEGGSMGVILNRPLQMELQAVWEDCPDRLSDNLLCASGGPVDLHKGILLHRYAGVADSYEVGPNLFIGGEPQALTAALDGWRSTQPAPLRLFLGHAGWSPGQLQDEIDRGNWLVSEGHPNLVLNNEPDDDFWETCMRAAGGFPRPSMN